MHRHNYVEKVWEAVLEGKSGCDIWSVFREYDADTLRTAFDDATMSDVRKQVEELADKMSGQLTDMKRKGPLYVDLMDRTVRLTSLAGDCIQALCSLRLKSLEDMRDVDKYVGLLETQSTDEKGHDKAIMILDLEKHPAAPELRQRFEALFPPDEDEGE